MTDENEPSRSSVLPACSDRKQARSAANAPKTAAWTIKILKRHGLTPPMSRNSNCPDNAPMKNELVHRTRIATRHDAKRALFCWIESYYNSKRRYSAIGYMTLAQAFEKMAKAA